MTTMIKKENNNNNTSIKVKVLYTLRGSKSTRLTTFSISNQEEEQEQDVSTIPISLKTCLWSICSSSPDMICRDHDLSIYTANFHESNKDDSLIWQGHGLLTWIMDQEQEQEQDYIYGKSSTTTHDSYCSIDIYIELQPAMKWIKKDDYFSALKNKSFEQFKNSTLTPLHPICQCYQQLNTKETIEFDAYSKRQHHQTTIFRPEPIYSTTSPPLYNNNKREDDLILPIPSLMNNNSRRSAFTIASISDKYLPPTNSNSSTSSTASPPPPTTTNDIPVIYAPSNKKRKKNPIIMPASSSSSIENHQPLYQTPPTQQQVNTVVRTYYEVDRDNQGTYILPVEIDSWTVGDLGTVIYDRPAYHNQRYIYPANYTVRKWYRSMVDPKSDTQYTCRILENGREPKFEVTADDCPITYSGPTPTTVWTIIVRRAFAIRNQEYGHNPVGPDFFGLRKNTIAKMIQDLPNASKCSQYVWQTFEPARFNKPGRNRRRADSNLPGSLLGGVNYGLTSSRLIQQPQHSSRAASHSSFSSSPQQQNEDSPRITNNHLVVETT